MSGKALNDPLIYEQLPVTILTYRYVLLTVGNFGW